MNENFSKLRHCRIVCVTQKQRSRGMGQAVLSVGNSSSSVSDFMAIRGRRYALTCECGCGMRFWRKQEALNGHRWTLYCRACSKVAYLYDVLGGIFCVSATEIPANMTPDEFASVLLHRANAELALEAS